MYYSACLGVSRCLFARFCVSHRLRGSLYVQGCEDIGFIQRPWRMKLRRMVCDDCKARLTARPTVNETQTPVIDKRAPSHQNPAVELGKPEHCPHRPHNSLPLPDTAEPIHGKICY
jgi:hypothetical protein